ncbi:DUF3052 family protein [Mucilaginibacter sp. L3T2-6]|uniref:DUF3052 family protein n=1 Tax=Mucilaginibacter sp. L3T2-6 TaxID=3062491 RepID=UPI0026774EAA|nr:DUF3052 family protein [Mucilaginibacter sp. L3T2-6]MDO3644112.1 DUF3052 family protein [Mucilaginibacter sp. L3T2-6]MDV6216607.1 DUF3052 family protein [Mucilaginibacter sp. L3T2-6]
MGMGSKVTAQTAGYSGTPLAKKLGIKPGFNIRLINAPENYFKLFADLPEDLRVNNETFEPKDLIHFFTREKDEYFSMLTGLRSQLKPGGMIWISWPKKSSKVKTDISEDVIRDFALQNGLVDIKVCAVDEVWSGLKLVIPVKDRI